ncbi:MAG TPA: DUF1566 domain-containing protein [Candidatus Binatia bacterium]|jgi:hypothetical protein|nr:DUF1566 domain-containing protein [Candidatus Binatia bacterium]
MYAARHARTTLGAAVAMGSLIATLLGSPGPARAEFGPDLCLAQKAKAWGTRRQCERAEDAKAVLHRSADRAKCLTRFRDTMATLDARAEQGGFPCRFRNNGDNTITDFQTGLMWVQLRGRDGVASADLLDVDNRYDWKTALQVAADLNGSGPFPPTMITPVPGNGGYADWRLPNFLELATIKDASAPGCGAPGPLACVDAIFEATIPGGYWSSTSFDAVSVWWAHFGDPTLIGLSVKDQFLSVRPVRTAF